MQRYWLTAVTDSLTALGKKAGNIKYVEQMEVSTYGVSATIRHHTPAPPKAPIIRLLEAARDDPTGPWAAIGAKIGEPLGKAIGKQIETA
jgi:hypothetical protein